MIARVRVQLIGQPVRDERSNICVQSESGAKEATVGETTGNISPSPNPDQTGVAPPATQFDSTMLATATSTSAAPAATTTATDSAAHMSSYGAGLATTPAYGASSLGAYSAYPYGSLVSSKFLLWNFPFWTSYYGQHLWLKSVLTPNRQSNHKEPILFCPKQGPLLFDAPSIRTKKVFNAALFAI